MNTKALQHSTSLKATSLGFLIFWCFLALFPLLWIAIMSFKLPIDSFSSNPLQVIFGFSTLGQRGGISLFDGTTLIIFFIYAYRLCVRYASIYAAKLSLFSIKLFGWLIFSILYIIIFSLGFLVLTNIIWAIADYVFYQIPVIEYLVIDFIGFTSEHYQAIWIEQEFYENFINSVIVTAGVVSISLSVGTLAGYGLARSGSNLAFWLLIIALIFRALPHSVLLSGYLPYFIHSAEILRPILGDNAPTLYGQPWAVILVLVSINQPFTIWMLRSFFQNIPKDLDEAARIDGCSHFEAFWRVIMPVMWPGVITTGLFSFLLAYNDFLVTSLLLSAQNQTMVPAISNFFNRETTSTDQIEAIAAAVSITAPLFLLVMVFQKQIVSGLVQGAVKG